MSFTYTPVAVTTITVERNIEKKRADCCGM